MDEKEALAAVEAMRQCAVFLGLGIAVAIGVMAWLVGGAFVRQLAAERDL